MAPGQIGAMKVRNRVVMSPMETMYGTPDGLPSERTRDYFAARARGGVGLITLGATGIDNQHPETPRGLHLATDEAVDAHRALVEVVHEHGAKIQPQIVHAGPDGLGPEIFGVTSLGPSVIPSYLTGRPSVEISKQQLCAVFDLFRAAARRAVEAGYDGVELHAAHGYMLLGSFLAPQRNRRTDDYRGDSARGRARVVLDALAAIRSEIGDALPITLRISGYERVAGGRPIFETAQLAPEFVAAGVNAFHVSGGVIDRLVTGMVNGADDGDELNVGAAAAVKASGRRAGDRRRPQPRPEPRKGSPPRRWCSPRPVAPPGSYQPTASCSPARSSPTPLCSTRWSQPCPGPRCTPPATAPGWG